MRGNVIDLAVAVVIGAAFTLVVNSLVDDIINPILAAIVGKPDFSDLTITIRDSTITYGNFITAIINFLLVAAAIYLHHREADEHDDGTPASGAGHARSGHQAVPGVPQHRSRLRPPAAHSAASPWWAKRRRMQLRRRRRSGVRAIRR